MGIPQYGELRGYTNGIITTYDYSIELGAIATNIALLTTQVAAINVWLSPKGALIPHCLANSADCTSNMITQIAGHLRELKTKSDTMSSAIKGMQGSLDANSSAVHEQVAISTLQAADQIEHNSFQKQATLDALKRNDLPAPVPPKPMDEIKAKIKNAEIIHAEALMVSTVASLTDNIISKLKNYILTSTPVIWAEEVVSSAWDKMTAGIKNFFADLLPETPKAIADEIQQKENNAKIPASNTYLV